MSEPLACCGPQTVEALRAILGPHARRVGAVRVDVDIAHYRPITANEIAMFEAAVPGVFVVAVTQVAAGVYRLRMQCGGERPRRSGRIDGATLDYVMWDEPPDGRP